MRQMHVVSLLRATTWRDLAGVAIAAQYSLGRVLERSRIGSGRDVVTPIVSMSC
ncbi:hypothetical protein RCH14_002511 [Massilia sp. MP_M2]|uniref:hypothetical protein n=1 Tax=Massilia sp. MP_M2 TaxID=3071713 RepID=UPI00319EB3D1